MKEAETKDESNDSEINSPKVDNLILATTHLFDSQKSTADILIKMADDIVNTNAMKTMVLMMTITITITITMTAVMTMATTMTMTVVMTVTMTMAMTMATTRMDLKRKLGLVSGSGSNQSYELIRSTQVILTFANIKFWIVS